MPPLKFVAPMLGTLSSGTFMGSISTTGMPACANWARCGEVSSDVTRMSPSRPAPVIFRAQAAPSGSSGAVPMTTSMPASAAASVTPWVMTRLFGLTSSSKVRSMVRTGDCVPPGPRAT